MSPSAGSEEAGAAGRAPENFPATPHKGVNGQGPAAQEDRQHRVLQTCTPANARLQAGSAHIAQRLLLALLFQCVNLLHAIYT